MLTIDFEGQAGYPQGGKAVLLQPDDKIVAAGSVATTWGYRFAAARIDPDGNLDTSFDEDGKLITGFGNQDQCFAMIQQQNGEIFLAGTSYQGGYNQLSLFRINPDGSLDTSFSEDGRLLTTFSGGMDAEAIALQPDNRLVVAGYTYVTGADFNLVRFTLGGTFSYDPNGKFYGLGLYDQAYDSFTYEISDGNLTDTATVTITINGTHSQAYLPAIVKACLPPNVLLQNGDFEMGRVGWTELSPIPIITKTGGHTGNWMAVFEGADQSITQTVTVPGCSPYLNIWKKTINSGFGRVHYFAIKVNGVIISSLDEFPDNEWCNVTVDLKAFADQTVELTIEKYIGDRGGWSNFYVDDISFQSKYVNNCF